MGRFNCGHQRGAALLGAPAPSLAKGYQGVQKGGCSRTQAKPPPAKAIKPRGGALGTGRVWEAQNTATIPQGQQQGRDTGRTEVPQQQLFIKNDFSFFLVLFIFY